MKIIHWFYIIFACLAILILGWLFLGDIIQEKVFMRNQSLLNNPGSALTEDNQTEISEIVPNADNTPPDDLTPIEGWLTYHSDKLNIDITYPNEWKLGDSDEFNYDNYYIYLNSNIAELNKGYDFNTSIDISQTTGDIKELADNLENGYAASPAESGRSWERQTDQIKDKFTRPVEMVKLQIDEPMEGLPYVRYIYFVDRGSDVIVAQLTVGKLSEVFGIDETQLQKIGEEIIYRTNY